MPKKYFVNDLSVVRCTSQCPVRTADKNNIISMTIRIYRRNTWNSGIFSWLSLNAFIREITSKDWWFQPFPHAPSATERSSATFWRQSRRSGRWWKKAFHAVHGKHSLKCNHVGCMTSFCMITIDYQLHICRAIQISLNPAEINAGVFDKPPNCSLSCTMTMCCCTSLSCPDRS